MSKTKTNAKLPFKIGWRPEAIEDLRAIVRYIAGESAIQARSFGKKLRDATIPLAQYPRLGRTGRPGLPEAVHELVVHANYIVFYRVRDADRMVEILRVKHAARQMPDPGDVTP
jgi:toxin ParE1/3/4